MSEKCNPSYKNLNLIQSFSEQAYATVQWCQQNCENDEYLKREVDKLKYLSPPSIGKWFPIADNVDDNLSFGHAIVTSNDNSRVQFSRLTDLTYDIGLDSSMIDRDNSTCSFSAEDTEEEDVDDDNVGDDWTITINSEYTVEDDSAVRDVATLHTIPITTTTTPKPDNSTTTFRDDGKGTPNSGWYVGYDKSKSYYVEPKWLKKNGWMNKDIPSVARAQTFRVKKAGRMVGVDLKLYLNGHPKQMASPLYVQLWKTKKRYDKKTIWISKKEGWRYVYQYEQEYECETQKDSNGNDVCKKDSSGNPILKKDNKGNPIPKKNSDGTIMYKRDSNGNYIPMKNEKGKKIIQREKVHAPVYVKGKQGFCMNKPLAQGVLEPTKMKSDLVTVMFDTPYKVKKNNYYAIVLFSPLSTWDNCFRWGGWGRNCHHDKHYLAGYSWTSEDNGRTWKRYGRGDDKVEYKFGKYVPQDFGLTARIEIGDGTTTTTEEYKANTIEYLYLKPIYTNPIVKFRFYADTDCTEKKNQTNGDIYYTPPTVNSQGGTNQKDYIMYEYYDESAHSWKSIPNTDVEITGKNPQRLLLRVRLWHSESNVTSSTTTPWVSGLHVVVKTKSPSEMYVTTQNYTPKLNPMLGASIWGKIYAPFIMDDTVECTMDIIENEIRSENITITSVDSVESLMISKEIGLIYDENKEVTYNSKGTPLTVLSQYTNTEDGVTDDNGISTYLTTHPELLEELKQNNIYVKPHQNYTSDGALTGTTYMLSFAKDSSHLTINNSDYYINYRLGGIQIHENVAYCLNSCKFYPNGDSEIVAYSEPEDFEFDYDNDILHFYKKILDPMPNGTLTVEYYPIFISGLTKEEVTENYLPDTIKGLSQAEITDRNIKSSGLNETGLILDYFKETFIITNENVENRTIPLRAIPVDPIKQVLLINPETFEETELQEYRDFKVNIRDRSLEFIVNNTDGVSTVLTSGYELQVVYTPNLGSNSIRLGYHAKRTNLNKQIQIKDYYIEYKP